MKPDSAMKPADSLRDDQLQKLIDNHDLWPSMEATIDRCLRELSEARRLIENQRGCNKIMESEVKRITERARQLERELAQRDGLLAKADEDLQLVQRALAFWHPGVGGRNDDAFLTRAGDDAMLLFGCAGPMENSAVELGWIKVIPDAAVTGEKP